VGSETEVYRENIETGAIVMRTAPSHIRFGYFEWFAVLGQKTEVKKLADFVIILTQRGKIQSAIVQVLT
jgi:uncharacterized protein YdiU (UPF0061 family)